MNNGAEDRNEGSQGRHGAKHQRLNENDDDVSSEDSTEVLAVQNIRFQEPKALDPNQVTLCRRLVNITLSKLMGEDTKQSNCTYIDVGLFHLSMFLGVLVVLLLHMLQAKTKIVTQATKPTIPVYFWCEYFRKMKVVSSLT